MSVGAYIHCKPDLTPFYVGKGTPKRMKEFHGRNKHHSNILKRYGRDGVMLGFIECSSDQVALELEIGLIKCLKNMGYELANYTAGGDVGAAGYRWTEEQRESFSSARKGMKLSDTHKANIAASMRGSKRPRSEEHIKNHTSSMQNRHWYNNGSNVVFCREGEQPDGYVAGRGSLKFTSKRNSK